MGEGGEGACPIGTAGVRGGASGEVRGRAGGSMGRFMSKEPDAFPITVRSCINSDDSDRMIIVGMKSTVMHIIDKQRKRLKQHGHSMDTDLSFCSGCVISTTGRMTPL